MIELEPLEVYTLTELRQSTTAILERSDENGALYILRYPRGEQNGRLYRITAMGPFYMTRKGKGSFKRPKLAIKNESGENKRGRFTFCKKENGKGVQNV